MRKHNKEIKNHLLSSLLPALSFGAVSGTLAGVAVTLYKFFAKGALALSDTIFNAAENRVWYIPVILLAALGAAVLLSRIYKKEPDLQGGGIPTSVGTLRGLFSFHPWKNALGSFFLSLVSFVFGVPLGTEGPSVQLSTALGAGAARLSPKKWHAWERFSMTGGASAGFAVATGAPISGIFFAIEEAHQRISPLITLTAVVAVLFAEIVTCILSPVFGVDISLFSIDTLPNLTLKEIWLPIAAGLAMGIFALVFLKFYRFLDKLLRKKLKIPQWINIFFVFAAAVLMGLVSHNFISTGHHLILEFFEHLPGLWMLLLIVVIRSLTTLSANISGVTGGIFLPLLAIGSSVGAVLAKLFTAAGMKEELIPLLLVFGIVGCIAGMMKMPLTAVIFGVEALGLHENLLPLIVVCTLAYVIPEALGEDSVGERVLERRKETLHRGKEIFITEMEVTVEEGSFAVGKETRDIFWPDGVRILSVKRVDADSRILLPGDVFLVRMSTYDRTKTEKELSDICSPQNTI